MTYLLDRYSLQQYNHRILFRVYCMLMTSPTTAFHLSGDYVIAVVFLSSSVCHKVDDGLS